MIKKNELLSIPFKSEFLKKRRNKSELVLSVQSKNGPFCDVFFNHIYQSCFFSFGVSSMQIIKHDCHYFL